MRTPRSVRPARSWLAYLVLMLSLLIQLWLTSVAAASVFFSPSTYTASENQASVAITVHRSGNLLSPEHVYYGTHKMDALPGLDYLNVGGLLTFLPGQTSASFQVPIIPRPYAGGLPQRAAAFLYGAWPDQDIAEPRNATISIQHDAPLDARDSSNPLALTPAPTRGNPLAGARFYIDHWGSPAGIAEQALGSRRPDWRAALDLIASQPEVLERFGHWDGDVPGTGVFRVLRQAYERDSGAVPLLATYNINQGQCGQHRRSDPPAMVTAYKDWADGLARGIGNFRAVMFFELDSLITVGCLSQHGLDVRMSELRYALTALSHDPHLVVYLDAGAADALPWQQEVRLLRKAGLPNLAHGFFLNSTHLDWTTKEVIYGQHISRALGGVHFVVNTDRNGRGPLRPPNPVKQGNEVLCNPPGRGLGPTPTSTTGLKWVDGFFWIMDPGESDGACRPGAPPSPQYWPAYAVDLARHANFAVTGPQRAHLLRDR